MRGRKERFHGGLHEPGGARIAECDREILVQLHRFIAIDLDLQCLCDFAGSKVDDSGREVVEKVAGRDRIRAVAGDAEVNVGTDMEDTLMEVMGRLNGLPSLPADSDPQVVYMGCG